MSTLRVTDISVDLGTTQVLDTVDLCIDSGQIVGLLGPNGSGKTTLIRTLLCLQKPRRGHIELDGVDIRTIQPRRLARQVAYLAQASECHWPLTVQRLVTLGRLPYRQPWRDFTAIDHAAVAKALRDTDVAHLAARVITRLSGGERVRAHLARALAGEPRLLFADEPVASLDPYHQLQVMDLLREIARRGGTVVVVLHDLPLAARFCDRLLLLDQGRLVADGTPEEVLSPANLASTFRIEAVHGHNGTESYVIPWQAVAKDRHQ